jgi:hypothetical protein
LIIINFDDRFTEAEEVVEDDELLVVAAPLPLASWVSSAGVAQAATKRSAAMADNALSRIENSWFISAGP